MPRIVHVIERYLDLSAGFVHGHISRSRYEPVVVSRLPTENLATFPLPAVRTVPRVLGRLPTRWRDKAVRARVLAVAQRAEARIAHAHFGYALPYATVLSERGGLPLVLSLHGHDATAWRDATWAYSAAARAQVAAVIAPSRWLATEATLRGFPADRIHVIPSGVDTTFFTPSPLPTGAPTAVFVGRLVEKKGIDVLLDAWPHVVGAVPDAVLHIVGDGPLRQRVDETVIALPSVRRSAPEPHRRGEQVRDAIRAAHVVVTPSHRAPDGDSESLLLVNLEAQASGRPVVTTNHGGVPEYVAADETALVVRQRDRDALVDAVIRVLRDRPLAAQLGAAGPALAARFDVAAMTARVDDLYDDVLARSTK